MPIYLIITYQYDEEHVGVLSRVGLWDVARE